MSNGKVIFQRELDEELKWECERQEAVPLTHLQCPDHISQHVATTVVTAQNVGSSNSGKSLHVKLSCTQKSDVQQNDRYTQDECAL